MKLFHAPLQPCLQGDPEPRPKAEEPLPFYTSPKPLDREGSRNHAEISTAMRVAPPLPDRPARERSGREATNLTREVAGGIAATFTMRRSNTDPPPPSSHFVSGNSYRYADNMRVFLIAALISAASFAANPGKITFTKDVLPILQKNCQGCHRPGEAAPTSFLTYQQTRPLAKAIRAAVLEQRMPPWPADPHVGKFANDRRLSEADKAVLVAWADTGAAEGNAKDAKPNPVFPDGWAIGKPDMIVEMPEAFEVPADGTIDYTYFILPTGLTEDKWVQMSEGRPGNRGVVHHIIAFVREPGSKWFADYPVNKGFVPKKGSGSSSTTIVGGYVPGAPPMAYRPGQAMLLKAGSDIVFQMHYTANGKKGMDKSKIGLVFAKEPVKQRVYSLAVQNSRFVIPPGADNFEVSASLTFGHDVELLDMQPHMHLRGKSAAMQAIYPTGETEKLLNVPKYDFAWQMSYQLPVGKIMPKGTKIVGTNHFDNSPNNKFNPDPKSEVRWGDQSWEEMMINFFSVAVDVNVKPSELVERKPAAPRAE